MEEDKYTCGSYDSGYCYQLGRPLTDKEDDACEYYCCIMSDNENSAEQEEESLAKMGGK